MLELCFVLLSLVVGGGFVLAARHVAPADRRPWWTGCAALGVTAWLAASGGLAAAGLLEFGRLPPPLMVLIIPALVGVFLLAWSRVGTRLAHGLPLWVLVGYQSFRIAVEFLLHRAHVEGLAPVQLTYLGRNFDVITGVSALLLAVWLMTGRQGRTVLLGWNVVGLALLANVFITALLSAPTPLQVFHEPPPNVWVAYFPFVWLPAVMVTAALLGHLLVFRRLLGTA
jgi:hypothetical protein